MARTVASITLRTEVQPLMPHAQGISAGRWLATSAKPNGKGSPIQKANGAMRARVTVIFAPSGHDSPHCMSGPSSARANTATPTMLATARTMALPWCCASVGRALGEPGSIAAAQAGKHQKGTEDDGRRIQGMTEEQHEALHKGDFHEQEGQTKGGKIDANTALLPPCGRLVLQPPEGEDDQHDADDSSLHERGHEDEVGPFQPGQVPLTA